MTLKDHAQTSAGELRAFVKERVAAYKHPRVVWLVDELPKGPTGKILEREITPPDVVDQHQSRRHSLGPDAMGRNNRPA